MIAQMVRIATSTAVLAMLLLPGNVAAAPAVPGAGDWPVYGGDVGNMRYAGATLITPANVSTLQLAWQFHTGVMARNTSFESTAVEASGRLFVTAPDDEVFALDPQTGNQLWHATPTIAPHAATSRVNRGVAYGDGKVYLATIDARLLAFDAATGNQVWARQLLPPAPDYFESMAPQFDRGRVIVGIAAGEHEIRGFVAAIDAQTGNELWRFNTVPGPHDVGGATWPPGTIYTHGGGPVWMTPAADPALDLIYFNVTNPSPDFNGSNRAGQNLFTNSVVAVHAATGTLAWYFQEVHHDLWDYDPASPPVLIDLTLAGATVPALIQAGKTGFLYVLDRRTGKPLVPTPERSVPAGPAWQHAWPTQPEPQNEPFAVQCPPQGLFPHESCIFTPPSEVPTLNAPGGIGGSAWSPVSFSPRTGLAYIAANNYPMVRSTTPRSCCFGRAPLPLPTLPPQGSLVGYDVVHGRVAWRVAVSPMAFGGSVVTATDLVFSGESSGYFDAHDARTGKLQWRVPTIAGADAAPSIYMAGGHEYVAIAAGGNSIINSRRGDTLDVYTLP